MPTKSAWISLTDCVVDVFSMVMVLGLLPNGKANDGGDGAVIVRTAVVCSTEIMVLVKEVFIPLMSTGEAITGRVPGVKDKLQVPSGATDIQFDASTIHIHSFPLLV